MEESFLQKLKGMPIGVFIGAFTTDWQNLSIVHII